MKNKVHKFRCTDCVDRFICLDTTPKRVSGATLKYGHQYCRGGKKVHAFRPRDPKVYPPAWCPKRKSPAEYRVYTYVNETVRHCRELFKKSGVSISPRGYEYALRAEGNTDMSPAMFLKALKDQLPSRILSVSIHTDDVIEIDDGLRPYFFHVRDEDVEVLCLFDKAAALKNQYEGPGTL